jgi:sulfate transport system permease protein
MTSHPKSLAAKTHVVTPEGFRPPRAALHTARVLPGFKSSLTLTITYLSLIVLIPLAALVARPWENGWSGFWFVATDPRVLASLRLTFGVAAFAAILNLFVGLLIAWVLTRYSFPGKRLLDALVDLPFALPTAVAGVALCTLYAPNGWIGHVFGLAGIKIAYTPLGIFIALVFVGLPFVVRSVQPVLAEFDAEVEEAARTLGASDWQTFMRVILPGLAPALLSGFSLALARAVGEYGSVIFIAGNMPYISEITPLLIVIKLQEFDYAGAASVALIMLALSFAILIIINALQLWLNRRGQGAAA